MKRMVVPALLGALAGSAGAATITVAPGAVVIADDGVCSLREAIVNANAGATHDDCVAGEPGSDTIVLAEQSSYDVPDAFSVDNGLPPITSTLSVQGNGSTIRRTGTTEYRVIEVASSGSLTIERVTIRGGELPAGEGGGIFNRGTLVFTRGTIDANEGGAGGGLWVGGSATLRDCTIFENTAALGGGIYTARGSTLSLTNCTISGNAGESQNGGGIYNSSTTTITNCTITENRGVTPNGAVGTGGGIVSLFLPGDSHTLTIARSIISGNLPIIDGFVAWFGVEFGDLAINTPSIIVAERNIFGHSGLTRDEAYGVNPTTAGFLPAGTNIDATSDGANIPLEEILDGTLALNAPGATMTHALPKGSPAIDYGLDCAALATDQRGVSRSIDGDGDGTIGCDVGAYEFSCGNGIIDASAGEECDDGNTVEDDLCLSDCTLQCGDGELDPGEQCDDGNDDSNDGCAFCRRMDPVLEDDDESGATNEPAPPADDDEGSAVP